MFIFFSRSKLQITNGLFTQLLSFNRLVRRLATICKKSWQKEKKRLFSNFFMLAVFISLIKFSIIVFAV